MNLFISKNLFIIVHMLHDILHACFVYFNIPICHLVSGGSWGLGALGPAILWGPLQRVSSGGAGSPPPSGVRGRAPEAKHFGNNILKIG